MIISVLNQKGGVGKTTLAINIARYLTKKGKKTLLVDSDTQGSALNWHERSNGDLLDMTCISKTTLEKDILKYVDTYERIIIDGIPRVSPLTISAIKCSDIVLIPVQPSPYDIWATEEIVRHAKDRREITNGKFKAYFIVSRRIVNTKIGNDISGELEKMELPIFRSGTCQRVPYAVSADKGVTVVDGEFYGTEAYKEIEAIAEELEEVINGSH